MTCGATLHSLRQNRPARSAPVILGLLAIAATINTQNVHRIDISGHVSPRCWSTAQSWTPHPFGQRVRCNTTEPQLNVSVRELRSDGTLSPLVLTSWEEAAERGAVEILVTPNL